MAITIWIIINDYLIFTNNSYRYHIDHNDNRLQAVKAQECGAELLHLIKPQQISEKPRNDQIQKEHPIYIMCDCRWLFSIFVCHYLWRSMILWCMCKIDSVSNSWEVATSTLFFYGAVKKCLRLQLLLCTAFPWILCLLPQFQQIFFRLILG